MQAIFQMEQLKFEDALDRLLQAKVIYEQIGQYKPALEALVYGEKVSQITTFIRQCCARLSIADEIMLNEKDAAALQAQIKKANLSQESKTGSPESQDEEISFNGRVIPLKSAKLHEAFSKIKEIMAQISDAKAKQSSSSDSKEIIGKYFYINLTR